MAVVTACRLFTIVLLLKRLNLIQVELKYDFVGKMYCELELVNYETVYLHFSRIYNALLYLYTQGTVH